MTDSLLIEMFAKAFQNEYFRACVSEPISHLIKNSITNMSVMDGLVVSGKTDKHKIWCMLFVVFHSLSLCVVLLNQICVHDLDLLM